MLNFDIVPPRYAGALTDANVKINRSQSFYISGAVGSGKTHFAYSLAIAAKKANDEKADPPYYAIPGIVNLAELAGGLRSELYENRLELIEKLKSKQAIIFDDVGSESRSDFSNDVLFQILNHRYNFQLWTGFTSNFRIGELPYESRIVSRIAGIVGRNTFHFSGKKDRRIAN